MSSDPFRIEIEAPDKASVVGSITLLPGVVDSITLTANGVDAGKSKVGNFSSTGPASCSFRIPIPASFLEQGYLDLRLTQESTGEELPSSALHWGVHTTPLTVQPWPRLASLVASRITCVIAPHPDDEALIFGGTICALRERGTHVHIIWVTNGGSDKIGELRMAEAVRSADTLGATSTTFLEFAERTLEDRSAEVTRSLVERFGELKPDLVLAPSPIDWHTDHEATARCAATAAVLSGGVDTILFGEYYRPIQSNHIVDISAYGERKWKAVECHEIGVKGFPYKRSAEGLGMYRSLMLRESGTLAEAFCAVPCHHSLHPLELFYRLQRRTSEYRAPVPSLPMPGDPEIANPPTPDAPGREDLPDIDISILTYHSEKDLLPLLDSLVAQTYPKDKLHLYFCDHSENDESWLALEAAKNRWSEVFGTFLLRRNKNQGFSRGHNGNFALGKSPFLLCCNPDVTLPVDSILKAGLRAIGADPKDAAWEFRQFPYEHPKIYDPVTLEPDWCSAACLLLRRKAFEQVKGFDHLYFLYAEDVDLSLRLRLKDWRLRYCPDIVVRHGENRSPDDLLRPQHRFQRYADGLIRLRFGKKDDFPHAMTRFREGANLAKDFGIPLSQRWVEWIGVSRSALVLWAGKKRWKYPSKPSALRHFDESDVKRQVSKMEKPIKNKGRRLSRAFRPDSLSLHRRGDLWRWPTPTKEWPLVTLIIRTNGLRPGLLREALQSCANQTWPSIEIIVAQDGDHSVDETVEPFRRQFRSFQLLTSQVHANRSATGNVGLSAANGEFVGFLDDDDLLFADHVEVLATQLMARRRAPAAASVSIEVPTLIKCPVTPVYREFSPRVISQRSFSHQDLWRWNYLPINTVLFRRELFYRHGGMDETLSVLEDWDLWIRYSLSGPFAMVDKSTCLHRVPIIPEEVNYRQSVLDSGYKSVRDKHADRVPELSISELLAANG